MAHGASSCAACRRFQQRLARAARRSAQTRECSAGLCETIVPVHAGNRVLGFLQIGQVRLRAPTGEDVTRIARLFLTEREAPPAEQINADLWRTRYVSPAHYASLVQLLEIFARQLAEWYAQHAPTELPREPMVMLRAKEWIETHFHEPIGLAEAASVAQMSVWTFSRSFHRTFGVTFREFLGRTRIDHARQMLAHPEATVADTLDAVGFTSLAQFNRSFRKFVGNSPGKFRLLLARQRRTASRTAATIPFSATPERRVAAI